MNSNFIETKFASQNLVFVCHMALDQRWSVVQCVHLDSM